MTRSAYNPPAHPAGMSRACWTFLSLPSPYHSLPSLPSPYHLLTPPKSSPWGPRVPPRPLAKPSFFDVFFQLDFCSPKYPQNGQKIAPKSTKNPVKIASESHARFCIHFYIGFYRFAVCLVLIAKATTCVSYRKIQCFLQVARFTTRAFHMPFPNENERKTVSKINKFLSKILLNFN